MKNKNSYQNKTEQFFTKYVSGKKELNSLNMSKAGKIEFEKFFNFLNLPKKTSLIELGSGYGRFALELLRRDYKVTAVDISQKSLNILFSQAKKNKINKNLRLLKSDFSEPQEQNKYDAAYCISTFHLLAGTEKERVSIFSNLVKSVKKGGKVVVIEPNPLNPFYYPFYWFSDQVSWEIEKTFIRSTEFNLKKIFKNLDLKNIEVSYMGFLPNRFINVFYPVFYFNKLINSIPLVNVFSSFIYIKGEKK